MPDPMRASVATASCCRLMVAALVVAVALPTFLSHGTFAHGSAEEPAAHSLTVRVGFPDAGIGAGEQLCLDLHAGNVGELTAPVQSQCVGQGANSVTFGGLDHGAYRVVVPAPDSTLTEDRYAGQVVETEVPDQPDGAEYVVDVQLALPPELAGTTGNVDVEVYACPPGTDGQGDATLWASQCQYRAGGVSLVLSGVGSVDDTVVRDVTGEEGDLTGRVEFGDLPAGAYQLAGDLPDNVATNPALFVTSKVEGTITALEPGDTVAVRPAEEVEVDVFLVLDEVPTTPSPAPTEPASNADAPPSAGSTTAPDAGTEPDIPAVPVVVPTVTGALDSEP